MQWSDKIVRKTQNQSERSETCLHVPAHPLVLWRILHLEVRNNLDMLFSLRDSSNEVGGRPRPGSETGGNTSVKL